MNETSTKNPDPAPRQIWRLNDPSFSWAGPQTIRIVDVHADEVEFIGGACSALSALRGTNPAWQCIGIETPAGRVMVGERRAPPLRRAHEYDVLGVVGAATVLVRLDGETYEVEVDAVAHWPLVSAEQTPALPSGSANIGHVVAQPSAWAPGMAGEDAANAVRGICHEVARICGISERDVTWEEDHARARVSVRVPAGTSPSCAALADRYLRECASVCVDMGVFIGPKKTPPAATMTDPRPTRERRRSAIDRVLAEDRRRCPTFATARMSAALVVGERGGDANEVETLLRHLHAYEDIRGGGREASRDAYTFAAVHFGDDVRRAYERGRAA